MTIGQVAKQVGVSTDTIRLYERDGLLDKPARLKNGYRFYTEAAIQQLQFIQRAKVMGFTLHEIQELLVIHRTSSQSCGDVKHRAQVKLQLVNDKIQQLKTLQNKLKSLVRECETHKPDDLCSIFT
tara:strand:- start:2693 stop:3070 length:378 start_codon:yes stop_codon:yes gene_type:complete